MSVNSLTELLEKPFKSFTHEEQLQIVRRGRFTDLVNLSLNDKGKKRTFWTTWYQKIKWLAGDSERKKLYCWNCILFPSGVTKTWNQTGFADLRNLSQATKKHEETREHIYATVKLRLLCKKYEKKNESTKDFQKNVEVKRNREYLKRLIDISSTLTRVEMPFRKGFNEDGPYGSVLQLLKKYDDITRTQFEESHNFHGLTTTIQLSLIQSMEQVVQKKITEEVAAASFFSLMVDEMNIDPEVKHISLSIRYIKNGEPIERFIGLFEVSHATKANDVATILDRELGRFNYKDKMVTQSYGGKVVKATELYSLQQSIKRQQSSHCRAQLIHCYAHDFRLLLAQSLSCIQECKLFFSAVELFCKFFQNINLYPDKKSFASIPSCIGTLKTQYESILRHVEYITIDEQYENTLTVVADAVNLINHLKTFKFMVFVTTFDQYFSLIQEFINRFKENALNSKLCRDVVNNLIDNMKQYKEETVFINLIQSVAKSSIGSLVPNNIFLLNVQILDNLIHEIEGRFLDIELSDFFALVNLDNFTVDKTNETHLVTSLMVSIKENYPKFFDLAKLKSELELLYADPLIGGIGDSEIRQVGDILKFIYDNDIKDNIPVLYKFLELVVTVPSLSEPLEGKLSVLNRSNSYLNGINKEEPRSALAVLTIEKDMLLELENTDTWYSQVIGQFATLPTTSSIELVYKNKSNEQPCVEVKTEVICLPELQIKSEPDTF